MGRKRPTEPVGRRCHRPRGCGFGRYSLEPLPEQPTNSGCFRPPSGVSGAGIPPTGEILRTLGDPEGVGAAEIQKGLESRPLQPQRPMGAEQMDQDRETARVLEARADLGVG